MTLSPELRSRIDDLVHKDPVLLFMKGNRQFPQCGFSATVVHILNEYLPGFATVNVLTDPELREGIKEYSDWPTIPQLYVRGEFVGGCDIVKELHANGELAATLGVEPLAVVEPEIEVTEAALAALRDALADAGSDELLRVAIGPGFEHDLTIGPEEPGDVVVQAIGPTEGASIRVALDRSSARKAGGLKIDFTDGPAGAGFKLSNPNRPKG